MENFNNYLDDGTTEEKLVSVIEIAKDLALICAESNDTIRGRHVGGLLSLVVLRLQQVSKELASKEDAQ